VLNKLGLIVSFLEHIKCEFVNANVYPLMAAVFLRSPSFLAHPRHFVVSMGSSPVFFIVEIRDSSFGLLCMISLSTPNRCFYHESVKKMEKRTINLSDEELIIKRYKIRATGSQNASIETTIPREAFEREARRQGMTTEEALRNLTAVWRFNSFRGLHLSFENKTPNDNV